MQPFASTTVTDTTADAAMRTLRVVSPVLHSTEPVAPPSASVIVSPAQKEVGPVITGCAGTCTVTTTGADVPVHPAPSSTNTE